MDNKLCRLCCINEGAINIFSNSGELKISSKIMYCCASLHVSESDELPALICDCCNRELELAYSFITKCEASERKLRLQVSDTLNLGQVCKTEIKLEKSFHSDDSNIELALPQDKIIQIIEEVQEMKEQSKKVNTNRSCKKRDQTNIKKIFRCLECGKEKANGPSLMIHMQFHNKNRQYQCNRCDKQYKDRGGLTRHIERNHVKVRERNFICEGCGKGFYTKNDVTLHMRIHTGEKPFACPECPKRFTQMATLLRHKIRHTGLKSHKCNMCSKSFCTNEELKHHFLVHTDNKKYTCPICGVPIKYKNSVKKHILVHSGVKNFICDYCAKSFRQKGGLKKHIDSLHSEKSGYCVVCSKNVPDIEVHMWRHTGHKPLKCNLCSSQFSELKVLSRHVNYYHKHPDKFKCSAEGCEKAFPSKPMLDFHTAKLHEMVIPFPCCKCSRGFYRTSDLVRHMNGTHKERLVIV